MLLCKKNKSRFVHIPEMNSDLKYFFSDLIVGLVHLEGGQTNIKKNRCINGEAAR